MPAMNSQNKTANNAGNRRVVFLCLFLVAGMGGMAYAAVPLYQLFCQVTGYGGTTQRTANSEGIPILDREITVRFDANTAPELGWNFYPAQRSVTMKLGEVKTINYFIDNDTSVELNGMATFNVTPQSAGYLFNKMECFCFTETKVPAGEKLEMPVVFFVDPELVDEEETKDIQTITLSYTFYPSKKEELPVASSNTEAKDGTGG